MKTHELKTWPVFFQAVINGTKTFEVRKNDRNFQVGDLLELREYDPDREDYTGNMALRKVVYILGDNPFFQLNNTVIMGIADKNQSDLLESPSTPVVGRKELLMDLKQYITNALYYALDQGFKLRHYAGIGEGIRNADTGEFDKWVEEQTGNIDEYLSAHPISKVTDEDIEKWAETYTKNIFSVHSNPRLVTKDYLIEGAKAYRDGLIPISQNTNDEKK